WNFDSTSVPSSLILISIPKSLIPTNSVSFSHKITPMSVFPNPATQMATIQLSHFLNTTTVSITDPVGKQQFIYPIVKSPEQLILNLNIFPSGTYLITVGSESQKLTIIH
ncbi:MAG TPA: T9SS type A sorting domain-containing protein, partial [Candidatus Kapabacteria bacterium]|nr:T9SS type A sorting domain-containing protein [Candidatus Kapabacteria bacterium]